MQKIVELYLNRDVVVRSNLSGVWMGRVVAVEPAENALWRVALGEGYKVHGWQRTAATSGLAHRGPGEGSRICTPTEGQLIGDACEIILATPAAMRQLRSLPVWDFPTAGV